MPTPVSKRITLLRHAKSSHDHRSQSDRARPLNQRGERDAPIMGRRLLSKSTRPSLIVTSPAIRARQTARLLAQAIGYPIEFVQTEQDLYLAHPETILDVIAGQDNTFNDIVVVGHNPGITELVNRLGGTHIDNIPTCGMVLFEKEIDTWDQLSNGSCRLLDFDYPKKSATF